MMNFRYLAFGAVLFVNGILNPGLSEASGPLRSSATEEVSGLPAETASERFQSTIDPYEAYLRTQAVIDHYGVAVEPNFQTEMSRLDGLASVASVKARLKEMDRGGAFSSFYKLTGDRFQVFRDAGSRQVLDYEVRLTTRQIPRPKKVGLKGLRIAIDPGHMGSKLWDERTGKYVDDKKGNRLSEGTMALQVALLLEKDLVARGAKVFLTRRSLKPVSPLDYDTYDLKPWSKKELLESSMLSWFKQLIEVAPVGPKLFAAFDSSSDFKKLSSESMRWKYFVLRADLDARAKEIQAFNPDLMVDIHFDTADPANDSTGLSRGHDETKVYVSGGFEATEFASREDRFYFGQHLLNEPVRANTIRFARSLAKRLSQDLKIPLDKSDGGNSVLLEPGVLARNLAVSRKLVNVPTAYLECLFYNDPTEFSSLIKKEFTIDIDGVSHSYSKRLLAVKDAILNGFLDY